jgi:outer membrane lipoprotein-sorting protein
MLGLRGWFLLLALAPRCFGQAQSELKPPPPLSPAEGQRQARALVSHLLAQTPEQASTNAGVLRIRDAQGNQRSVPVQFEIVPTATNWLNIYHTSAAPGSGREKLTISHRKNDPNQYWLEKSSATGPAQPPPQELPPTALMAPFAGSDFWIADLGLEFLHWPEQRVLKKQMRKGLSCDVLQSVNPQPAPGSYSRVLSWIAINRPEDIVIVHAEAYDARDKLLKEFDPKKVEKVNGAWQLEEMEIRNRQTGSRTKIGFDLNTH